MRRRHRSLGLILIMLVVVACSKSERNQEHETYWEAVSTANTAEQYEHYLQQHPNGIYREEALSRLVSLASERQRQLEAEKKSRRPRENIVASVQGRLNELGFNVGPADGVVGPKTRNAIAMFERQANRSFGGRIDRKLLAALLAATPVTVVEASAHWLKKAELPKSMHSDLPNLPLKKCTVRMTVSSAGLPESVLVIPQRCQPESELAKPTVAAAQQSRFRPRTVDGIPEAVNNVLFTAIYSADSCQRVGASGFECRVSVELQ